MTGINITVEDLSNLLYFKPVYNEHKVDPEMLSVVCNYCGTEIVRDKHWRIPHSDYLQKLIEHGLTNHKDKWV